MSNRKGRVWYPPQTLIGPHWEVQLLHVNGHWVTYTEHTSPESAYALAARFDQCATFRVHEVA